MTDNRPLAGKVAVIMGASGGIGAATARRLAAAGAQVVATYAGRQELAEQLVASLPAPAAVPAGQPQPGHLALPARVEDSASLAGLAVTVGERFGKVDILVNSAGFTRLPVDFIHRAAPCWHAPPAAPAGPGSPRRRCHRSARTPPPPPAGRIRATEYAPWSAPATAGPPAACR